MQKMFSYVKVKGKVELINQDYPALHVQFRENDGREANISNPKYVVIISWQLRYANTLSDSSLQIVERKRSWYPQESDEINRQGLNFHLDEESKPCWKERNGNRCLTTQQLGNECIDRLLHLISNSKNEDEDART